MNHNELVQTIPFKDVTFRNILRTFVVIFLIFFINSLYAQSRFVAGIKTGLTSSQVSGDNLAGFNHFGFTGGAFVKSVFNNQYEGKFEIVYFQKGSRKTANLEKGDINSYQLDLNYIEIPVLVGYKNNKFTFEVGPSFGALFSGREAYNESQIDRPFFNKEISMIIGLNYPISDKFILNWRFTNSILPIRKHLSNETFGLNRGQYNSALAFTLNYVFKND